MASETSRSGGTADSYIGSLISLTSKSEIRYEGVLYNINTEESSIGLRNVRSFGTEGRKKDGPQIPPSDKVYEYILFRGSDIKDLEVKSSPLLQPVPQIHNDPAIIQSHFPRPTTSISNPTVDGPVADLNTHAAQTGLLRPTFQGNLPIYHPGGTLAPWGSSPPPNAVGTGIAGPMYWQGFYGPASGVPHLQQQLLPPPPTLSAPHPIHPQLQYRSMNPSLPSGIPTLMPEFPSQLPSVSGLNLASTTLSTSVIPPVQSPALDSETQASLLPGKGSSTSFPSETPAASLAPLASSDPEKNSIPASIVNKPRTIPGPSFPYQNTSQAGIPPVAPSVPVPTAVSSSLTEKRSPSLVTPDQLLAPGSSSISSSQLLQSGKQGTDIKIQTSVRSEPIPAEDEELLLSSEPLEPTPTEDKGPILLLPIPDNDKMIGAPSYNDQNNRWPARSRGRGKGVERGRGIERGGRGMERGRGRNRGRGYGISHSIVEFTEDFDFVSMNEKFKKDEVWGDLGRSKDQTSDRERNDVEDDTDCSVDEDNVDSKNKIKPVYVKDDFFDSLSCTALNNDNQNGRTRFSDQMKIDTETFGEFAKYRTNRGGRGYSRGGRSGSSYYYNRGYSNTGRGRGRGRNPL